MTLFDVITVFSFVGIALLYFLSADRSLRMLLKFVLAGSLLAVANQVGNQGYAIMAAGMVAAAITFVMVQIASSG